MTSRYILFQLTLFQHFLFKNKHAMQLLKVEKLEERTNFIVMLYFMPTLQSDHIETKHQCIDQCHFL